jgi:hypothetical protein
MDQGKTYPLKRFLGNFSGHLKAGRIEPNEGDYRLTNAGMDYFRDRYRAGNRQGVNETDVQVYMNNLLNGGAGWESVKE